MTLVYETTFSITEAFHPRIYEGKVWQDGDKPKYGFLIHSDEVPHDFKPYARIYAAREEGGLDMVAFSSLNRPLVVCDNMGALQTTLACIDFSNLTYDQLMTKVPMTIHVKHYVWERESSIHGRKTIHTSEVAAIKVQAEDIIRRYNELCAEFFTGL